MKSKTFQHSSTFLKVSNIKDGQNGDRLRIKGSRRHGILKIPKFQTPYMGTPIERRECIYYNRILIFLYNIYIYQTLTSFNSRLKHRMALVNIPNSTNINGIKKVFGSIAGCTPSVDEVTP